MTNCFICNIEMGVSQRYLIDLFGENNTLKSGNKLNEVISEIVEKPLNVNSVHTNVICKKCHKMCLEYDDMKASLESMKLEILKQFKTSLQNQQMAYETYETDVVTKQTEKSDAVFVKKLSKRVVLPASKLQPLPPDFLLRVDRLAGLKACNNLDKSKPIIVTTVGTTVPISNASSIQNKPIKPTYYLSTLANKLDEHSNTNGTNDLLKNFNLASLTKEFVNEAAVVDEISDNHARDVDDDEENLKIDQDCAISVVPVTSASGDLVLEVQGIQPKSKATDNSDYVDVKMVETVDANETSDGGDSQNKYIFGKLQIINDGDDEDEDNEHTIVIYDANDLSLVVPDVISQQDVDHLDNGDSHDSNDESQIELQVSGDEETANAIIAAAQEQGGAFIKVESGEMYHVKSVQSKTEEEIEERQPLQMVTRDGDKFKCLLCENSIKNGNKLESFVGDAENIMQHLKSEHDARLYICSVCGTLLRKRSDYTRHIRNEHSEHIGLAGVTGTAAPAPGGGASTGGGGGGTSTGRGRVHACAVCGRTYNSRTLLAEHANLHTGVRPHSCPRCRKAFASKYTLQAHLKTHSERPRPYKCSHCDKSFLTQQNLNQHEKTHSGVKDFVCSVCNKAFSTQHNLEVHGVVHSKARPHRCPHCPKGFARAAELRDHCRTHTGERPFSCDICGATFTQRSNLHSHRRATHFGEKPHQCTQCNKRFKRRRLLDYHIKSSHTGERPLECKICSATFVYPEHYKKHIRIHSGERPYNCEICGKAFTSRDNRNTHRFVHSDKKPYECLACGAGYMRKNLLYAHMKSSGHLAESIVVNQPRVAKNINGQILNVESLDTKNFDAIFPSAGQLEYDTSKLENDEKIEIVDGTTKFLIGHKNFYIDDAATLNNVRSQDTLLDTEEVGQMVTSDVNGEMVRLIQIKLPDGNNGWMALNN